MSSKNEKKACMMCEFAKVAPEIASFPILKDVLVASRPLDGPVDAILKP